MALVEVEDLRVELHIDGLARPVLRDVSLTIEAGEALGLVGESGAGKSSLAYACARKGWEFLSDDSSALVRKRPGRIVVGNPHQMRFRESAIELFPELHTQRVTPRATGKMAIELATTTLKEIATATECQVDYIVFLNRREPARPGLSPLPREVAWPYFEQHMCFGEDEVYQAQQASIHELLTAKVINWWSVSASRLSNRLASLSPFVVTEIVTCTTGC